MYDTIKDAQYIKDLIIGFPNEYKFMHLYGKHISLHNDNEKLLLSLDFDQLNQVIRLNVFNREINKNVKDLFFRFKKPTFNKLFNQFFTLGV